MAALTDWSLFRLLCRILGGQDENVLSDTVAGGHLSRLVDLAQAQDVLPALAVRCGAQLADSQLLATPEHDRLTQALSDNTLRNMQISAQALKLCRILNGADIIPLFLKGTALLLDTTAHLGFRKQLDIDVLVRQAQLEAAAQVCLADGYTFYHDTGALSAGQPRATQMAIRGNSIHHHLPPLEKDGYAATVELHRHFLSKRFQGRNPLEQLFATAVLKESHGAQFLVAAKEYQMIHLILGKIVHDGHLARRTFPLREACDFIHLLESTDGSLDHALVAKHCGKHYLRYAQLVAELMAYPAAFPAPGRPAQGVCLQSMQKRFSSSAVRTAFDAWARAQHLTRAMIYSPRKLPAYLLRRGAR